MRLRRWPWGLGALAFAAALLAQDTATVEARLGPADRHYAHAALGSTRHPSTVAVRIGSGSTARELQFALAPPQVFEDGRVRVADLDDDGLAELLVVRSGPERGAELAVYGLDASRSRLVERAHGPSAGVNRWLNPVGAADFDGDGKLEVVAVVTPHIGGVLTLYRYEPPKLVPIARGGDVSNHIYGDTEQELAAIVQGRDGPVVWVPDQARTRLRRLRWDGGISWRSAQPDIVMRAPITALRAQGDFAEVELADGSRQRLPLR